MGAQGSVFPAFIRAEYDASGSGFPAFERAADSAFGAVEGRARQFSSNMENVQRVISDALAMPRNAGGSLDLNVAELKRSAEAAQARASAAREVAVATRLAAEAEGDYSQRARLAIAAAEAVAREHEQSAKAALSYASAQEQVQTQLNRTASQTQTVIQTMNRGTTAFGAVTNSIGAQRYATMQAAQQFQDFFVQIQGGQNPLVAFNQQASQLAFVMSGAGGAAGRFAAFMSGQWGTAIFAGISVLSLFTRTSKETADALSKVKFASDAVSDAQSVLGKVMDLATGKIVTQREELKALAKAQILVAQVQAQARAAEARGQVSSLQAPTTEVSGGIGGGFNIARRPAGARGEVARQFLAGELPAGEAIDRMRNLQKAGAITQETFAEAAAAIANFNVETANMKSLEAAERLLNGKATAGDRSLLLKPTKPKKDRSADAAATLAERGEDAAKKIANIAGRFADIPPQQEAVNRAMRELDDLANDFAKKKPPNYAQIVEQLKEAREIVANGLNKPFDDLLRNQRDQLEVLRLQVSGRGDEADALVQIRALERTMGDMGEERKSQILAGVEGIRAQSNELRLQQQLWDAQVQQARDIQSAMERFFEKPNFGNLAKSITDATRRRAAQELSIKLFGDLGQTVEDRLKRGGDAVAAAGDAVVKSAASAATESKSASSDLVNAAQRHVDAADKWSQTADQISAALTGRTSGSLAANDNALPGEIVVNGTRPAGISAIDASGMKIDTSDLDKALQRHGKMLDGLLGQKSTFSDTLDRFQMPLSLLGSAIGGKAGNAVSSFANIRQYEKLGDVMAKQVGGKLGAGLGKVTAGAGYGMAADSVVKALGMKGSSTGGALGGALGMAIGGPLGAAIGGALGSIAGGMLKKTKWGRVDLTASGASQSVGNSGASQRAATKAGGSFNDSLSNIAEQFGGSVGDFGSISLGQRHGDWRVNGGGTSLKVKKGAMDFNEDADAAIAYALQLAIERGAIRGIRNSTQNLLKSSDDLSKNLDKALKFEKVFRDLKAIKDPVGAAVDDINREFSSLVTIFKQAGATAQETAQLEELYNLKRKDAVKQAFDQVTSSLKGLLNDINIGDNGYSLRTRLANAQAAYNPLEARVQSGDTSAYDGYTETSRQLMDIAREYYGSGTEYFQILDRIKGVSQGQVDYQQRQYDAASSASNPFNIQPIVSATETQTQTIVAELQRQGLVANDNLKGILSYLRQMATGKGAVASYVSRWGF